MIFVSINANKDKGKGHSFRLFVTACVFNGSISIAREVSSAGLFYVSCLDYHDISMNCRSHVQWYRSLYIRCRFNLVAFSIWLVVQLQNVPLHCAGLEVTARVLLLVSFIIYAKLVVTQLS